MRSAGNFHPDWGYLAPAPGFLRTARIALVATAIGATAGAVVVVSLVARPGANDDDTSIAAHALVTSAPIVTAPAAPVAPVAKSAPPAAAAPMSTAASTPVPAQANAAAATKEPPAPAGGPPAVTLANQSTPNVPVPSAVSAPAPASEGVPNLTPAALTPAPGHAGVAAVADAPAVEAAPGSAQPKSADVPEQAATKKPVTRKRRNAGYDRWDGADGGRKRWRDNRGFPLFRLFSFRGGSSFSN